jgi:2-(1,2-epoxy-1,2-dihydrophenyl)acetyl-CoA isomerase
VSDLIETIENGIATLTFNRPERLNALSTPIMQGLLDGLPRLAGDPAVKVVVLTGAGRAFCAGGDVKSMAEGGEQRTATEAVAHLRSRMEVSRILHELPKPTIAMTTVRRRAPGSLWRWPAICGSPVLRHGW